MSSDRENTPTSSQSGSLASPCDTTLCHLTPPHPSKDEAALYPLSRDLYSSFMTIHDQLAGYNPVVHTIDATFPQLVHRHAMDDTVLTPRPRKTIWDEDAAVSQVSAQVMEQNKLLVKIVHYTPWR